MWHGKSAISRGTGYSQGRTARRATQDKSIRMSNKAEVGFGMFGVAFIGLVFLLMLAIIL
jgi:hypothetical protein